MKASFVAITAALAVSAVAHPSLMEAPSQADLALADKVLKDLLDLLYTALEAGPVCLNTIEDAAHGASCILDSSESVSCFRQASADTVYRSSGMHLHEGRQRQAPD